MARDLNNVARMLAPRRQRPFLILPTREESEEELHVHHIKLVPHACETCGELTTHGLLCIDCEDRARPHEPEDPYDIIGGDHGTE